jgi:RNA recognition motif-containing protein
MGDPQIYVRGFPKYTTEEDLKAAFGPYGEIREVRMIRDYAFIVSYRRGRCSTRRSPSSAQSTR